MVSEHTLIVSPLAAEILRFNSVPEGFKDGWGLGIHPRIDSWICSDAGPRSQEFAGSSSEIRICKVKKQKVDGIVLKL